MGKRWHALACVAVELERLAHDKADVTAQMPGGMVGGTMIERCVPVRGRRMDTAVLCAAQRWHAW
ncbi:hypothetical protein BKK80_33130 [Cupriavidus malaysiensis]|uniref:Uncharacterized protein n=1 Tax=Cupriavidus malaysiensis TaxID=367825 RepID=A0ABM6FEU8_9BURK|nr:hypothetical protein BKK80_33130 [Cupriavidus malaysiensis]